MTTNPRRNRLIVSSKVKSAPECYTDTGPDFRWAVSVRMGSDESGGKFAGFHRMKSGTGRPHLLYARLRMAPQPQQQQQRRFNLSLPDILFVSHPWF